MKRRNFHNQKTPHVDLYTLLVKKIQTQLQIFLTGGSVSTACCVASYRTQLHTSCHQETSDSDMKFEKF